MNNSENTKNLNLLQKFAVKSSKKIVVDNNTAVIYNRCSGEKQDSLDWQNNLAKELCKQKNFDIKKIFDAKESATTDERTVFLEMLKFCKKENIGNIVVYAYDRFSRTGDLNLINELSKKGVRVHAVTQMVDDKTPSGELTRDMYLLFARMENKQRRDRVIEGQKKKLRLGEWIGVPTKGYEKRFISSKKEHDYDKKQCFINEDGKLLKQAFHWKDSENLTNLAVIDRLEKMGLTLTPPQLTRIFRNPFYCGYITSTYLDEGEIIRGKHEALVSEDVFLRVNGIVDKNTHGWNVLHQNEEMPLKATLKCGICERPLTAYPQKGKYIYYKCPNNGCCVNINNKKLHELFALEISKYTIQTPLIPFIKSQLETTYQMLNESDVQREKPMKDELTRLKNELEVMEFNLVTSKITSELFQKFSSTHKDKIKEIEESLKSLAIGSSNFDKMLDKALELSSNLLNMWQLLDYNGKVRLQKLVFPDGLQYMHENHTLRTFKINPIISAITSISITCDNSVNLEINDKNEKLHQLYQMFASSNFFLENLVNIQNQVTEIKSYYPGIWNSIVYKHPNPISGATEVVEFNYTTNLTSSIVIPDYLNQNLYLGNSNSYSGTTDQSSISRIV